MGRVSHWGEWVAKSSQWMSGLNGWVSVWMNERKEEKWINEWGIESLNEKEKMKRERKEKKREKYTEYCRIYSFVAEHGMHV